MNMCFIIYGGNKRCQQARARIKVLQEKVTARRGGGKGRHHKTIDAVVHIEEDSD